MSEKQPTKKEQEKELEKINRIAREAAGLPPTDAELYEIRWWMQDNFDITRIEFVRKKKSDLLFIIELGDGQLYRALYTPGTPPELYLEKAGPGTEWPGLKFKE